jgi:hypothetical protein
MSIIKEPKRLALVVIDTASMRYSRYIGTQKDRVVEGAAMSATEVEHFRINPFDFIAIHCQPEVA